MLHQLTSKSWVTLPLPGLPSYSFDSEDDENQMDNVIHDLEMMRVITTHF